jgi:hypothetical protein
MNNLELALILDSKNKVFFSLNRIRIKFEEAYFTFLFEWKVIYC